MLRSGSCKCWAVEEKLICMLKPHNHGSAGNTGDDEDDNDDDDRVIGG